VSVRLATTHDVHGIIAIRKQRTAWLADRGYDQWQTGQDLPGFASRVHRSIRQGRTWVMDHRTGILGTVAVDDEEKSDLWSSIECAQALMIHRLLTSPAGSARGVGARLIDHVDQFAMQLKRRWLRLNAWTSNTDLHRYYVLSGFRRVHIAASRPDSSTALFERPVGHIHFGENRAPVAGASLQDVQQQHGEMSPTSRRRQKVSG
jgi:GNAT superfamily N-acetyltransferase